MDRGRTKRWSLFALLLMAVLVLAACGGGQSEPAPAAEDTPAASEESAGEDATTEEPAAAAGVIVVGTNAEYQPFEFVDAGGNIVGYDIDLMKALAAEAGLDVEFVNTKWDGIFVALANGEFDAVISAVTITDERKEVVNFTDAYFNAGQAVAVRSDNDAIAGVDDLVEGVSVGVQLGTTGDIYSTDNLPVEVKRFDETPLAIQALANGDVDAVVADAPTLADYIKANADLNLKVVGEPFTEELYGIAVNQDKPEVLDALNGALATIRENGTYDDIFNTWFGAPEAAAGGSGSSGEAAATGGGATFIFGRGADGVSLDPAVVTDGESFRVTNQGCDALLAYDKETTNVVPALAESWESNADGTEWTFKLREGVKFHDGTDFNADAVLFNFNRWWDPENPYHYEEQVFEYWDYMWGGFKGDSIVTNIEKVDDYSVKFTLSEPLAPILANLAMPMFSIASPAAIQEYGADYGTPEVGYVCTGPFKFVEWVTDDHTTMVRSEDYWGEIPGNVETIIIRTIPDNSARFLALQAGEIDALEQANIEDLASAEGSDDLYVLTRPALNTGYLAFNYRIQEFNDPLVREAIAAAIDKQGLVDAFYGGYGEVATQFLPPFVWGHNPDLQGVQYDPDRAVELLTEAGYPDGISEVTLDDGSTMPLTLYYMPVVRFYYPDPEAIGEAMAAQLAAVGINVKLELAGDWATYLDMRRNGELVGLYQLGWGGDNGDPDNFLGYFFGNAAEPKPSEGFFSNPELAEILTEARSTPDQAARTALYEQAEQILYETVGRVWIAHNSTPLIFRNEVSGYIPNAVSDDKYKYVSVE
ncbi:MAG: transporter substrate-binding domain-containing protein [Caldilineaceae bacterium]|nr:transporter substrate-binding domain-containing protein [Caldilineaceae bacterium]